MQYWSTVLHSTELQNISKQNTRVLEYYTASIIVCTYCRNNNVVATSWTFQRQNVYEHFLRSMVHQRWTRLALALLLWSRMAVAIVAYEEGDESICWISAFANSTELLDQYALGRGTRIKLGNSCPVMDTVVLAETNGELEANRDYTYQIRFRNNGTFPTQYRIVLCRTKFVRFCNVMKASQNQTVYVTSPFTSWPQGQDEVNVTITTAIPGIYAVFGHLVQQISQYQLLDVAQTIQGYTVFMTDQPEQIVLTNSPGFVIGVIVCSSIYALVIFIMMIYISWHRQNPILKLAQAPFLVVVSGCAVLATACTFVYLPLSNMACRLQGVLMSVPMTIMASTLVGRLWRTYSVLSAALQFGRRATEQGNHRTKKQDWLFNVLGFLANIHVFLLRRNNASEPKSTIRAQVNEATLARLIFVLSLPQLIAQIIGFIVEPQAMGVDLANSGFVSRQVCEIHWFTWVGILYLIFVLCLAIAVAWMARDLPSILNEKDAIFQACSINIVLGFVGILCIVLASNPTMNPDIVSLLWIILSVGNVSTIIWLIVWPKIAMIRKGHQIVVSKLLTANSERTSSGFLRHGQSEETIILRQNEAPPPRIEAQMLNLKNLLTRVCGRSLSGDPISLNDWRLLISSIQVLHIHLHRIEFAWKVTDEERTKYNRQSSTQDDNTFDAAANEPPSLP